MAKFQQKSCAGHTVSVPRHGNVKVGPDGVIEVEDERGGAFLLGAGWVEVAVPTRVSVDAEPKSHGAKRHRAR